MMAADAGDASYIDIGYVSKANQSVINFDFSILFRDNIWLYIYRRIKNQ